jgi:hypothetical protein
VNITAIASAVADRFAPSAITPPSGYTDPGTATHLMPNAITTLPTCVVFPPEGDFSYQAFKRTGDLTFPVRWYVGDASDLPRATQAMYDWAGVLLDQLEAQYDLDQGPAVTHAYVTAYRFGRLPYADREYTGIELTVVAHVQEAFTPTT